MISSIVMTYPFEFSTYRSVVSTLTSTASETSAMSTTETAKSSLPQSNTLTNSSITRSTTKSNEESSVKTQSNGSISHTRHFTRKSVFMTSSDISLLTSSVSMFSAVSSTRESMQSGFTVTSDNIADDKIGVTISWVALGISVGLIPSCVICMVTRCRKRRDEGVNNNSGLPQEHNVTDENDGYLENETEATDPDTRGPHADTIENDVDVSNMPGTFITETSTDNGRNIVEVPENANEMHTSDVIISELSNDNGRNLLEMTDRNKHYFNTETEFDENTTTTTTLTFGKFDEIRQIDEEYESSSKPSVAECNDSENADERGYLDGSLDNIKDAAVLKQATDVCSSSRGEVNIDEERRWVENNDENVRGEDNLEMQTMYLDNIDEENDCNSDITFV